MSRSRWEDNTAKIRCVGGVTLRSCPIAALVLVVLNHHSFSLLSYSNYFTARITWRKMKFEFVLDYNVEKSSEVNTSSRAIGKLWHISFLFKTAETQSKCEEVWYVRHMRKRNWWRSKILWPCSPPYSDPHLPRALYNHHIKEIQWVAKMCAKKSDKLLLFINDTKLHAWTI